MREQIHHGLNAVLRTSMADMLGDSPGSWGVFGCYWNGTRASWESLDQLSETLWIALRLAAPGGTIEPALVADAIGLAAEHLPEDAWGVRLARLRGIALIANVQGQSEARILVAEAVFDDGYVHTVNWRADAAAPTWTIHSPAEHDHEAEPMQLRLQALLSALQTGASEPGSAVSEEQRQLNVELRATLADRIADQCHSVFIILAATDGWEIIPPTDMNERLAAKASTGASLRASLEELAAEFEADPLGAIPICKGVGTVTHVEAEHGSVIAGLGAYCEGTWHSIMWDHDEAAPDWEITPAAESDPEMAEVIAAYARLTDAISGKDR